MKRYKDEAPPLLKWYDAYCTAHKLTPRPQPPIRILYSCRRMMDPDAPGSPTRADRERLAEHFAKPPGQPWVSTHESTGEPLNTDDPFTDYHQRRNKGEYLPASVLATALGVSYDVAKQRYYRWCKANNEVCIAQRPPRPGKRGPRKLTHEQITEAVELYTNEFKSLSFIAKRYSVSIHAIQFALVNVGVVLRTQEEANRIRYQKHSNKRPPLPAQDLDPWIRPIVQRLYDKGWLTTDSGDGNKTDMEGSLPYPHVFIKTTTKQLILDCDRLERITWWPVFPDIQGMYNPLDREATIMVSWPGLKA